MQREEQNNKKEQAQRIQPDAMKETAAAAERATEQAISDYAKVDAAAFTAMMKAQKTAYIQSLQEFNAQLTEYLEKLQRVEFLDDMPTFLDMPEDMPEYEKITGKEFVSLKELEEILSQRPEQAEQRADKSELAALKSLLPDKYIIPNTIISNAMTKGLVNTGNRQLDPSKGHRGKYYVYADIQIDPNEYAANGSFTRYDRRVLNGICSLLAAGNTAFTAEMTFRAMNGLKNSEYVSPQQAAAVTKSIYKLRNIDIKIDATEEFTKRKLIGPANNENQVLFEDKCLTARICTVKINGVERRAYQPTAKPILYEYAEQLNQIISVDSDLLTIKDEFGGRISNTDNFAAIREFLLQRIEIMKHNPKYNRTINIDAFYEEAEVNTGVSKYKTQARRQAEQCLDYWKSRAYIQNYEFTKKGKTIAGIKIVL